MEPRAKHEVVGVFFVMLNACSVYFFRFNKPMQKAANTLSWCLSCYIWKDLCKKNLFVVHYVAQCNKHMF